MGCAEKRKDAIELGGRADMRCLQRRRHEVTRPRDHLGVHWTCAPGGQMPGNVRAEFRYGGTGSNLQL